MEDNPRLFLCQKGQFKRKSKEIAFAQPNIVLFLLFNYLFAWARFKKYDKNLSHSKCLIQGSKGQNQGGKVITQKILF